MRIFRYHFGLIMYFAYCVLRQQPHIMYILANHLNEASNKRFIPSVPNVITSYG